jgi:hypothetical protein
MKKYLFVVITLMACVGKPKNENSSNIILKHLLNDAISVKSSAFLQKNKLTLSWPLFSKWNSNLYVKSYNFSPVDYSIWRNQELRQFSFVDSLRQMQREMFEVPNISSPDFDYAPCDNFLTDTLKKYCFNSSKNLCVKNKAWQIVVCQGNTKNIFLFDAKSKKINRLEVFNFPFKVKDFLLYDLIGDDTPEIVLFSESTIARDEELLNIDIFQVISTND